MHRVLDLLSAENVRPDLELIDESFKMVRGAGCANVRADSKITSPAEVVRAKEALISLYTIQIKSNFVTCPIY
jgi:hypothetical protein